MNATPTPTFRATNQPPLAQCSMPQSSQIWTCTRVASHEDNSAALANTAPSMTICVTARLAWPEEPAPRSYGEVTNGPHPCLPIDWCSCDVAVGTRYESLMIKRLPARCRPVQRSRFLV